MIDNIKPVVNEVVKKFNLNVVGECEHQFEKSNKPHGVTIFIISHLSIHRFVDVNKFFLDFLLVI